MKKYTCCTALVLFFLASVANAGNILPNNLTLNGLEDTSSLSKAILRLVDADTSSGISTGDIVFGLMHLTAFDLDGGGSSPVSDEIVVAVSAKIGTDLGGGVFSVVPNSSGSFKLSDLLVNVPTFSTFDATKEIFAIVTTPDNALDLDDLNGAAGTDAAALAAITGELDSDYMWEVTGGIDGGDDFFEIRTISLSLNPESAALSVLDDAHGFHDGENGKYIPVSTNELSGAMALKSSDVVIKDSSSFEIVVADLFQLQSVNDTDLGINIQAIPEPATFVVWGGLLGAVAFGGYRRRRKKHVHSAQEAA